MELFTKVDTIQTKLLPNGQICTREIFVEHSLEIFPVYSEKFPVKFRRIFRNNVPGILNIGKFPGCSMNILLMLPAFLGGSRNTIAVFENLIFPWKSRKYGNIVKKGRSTNYNNNYYIPLL